VIVDDEAMFDICRRESIEPDGSQNRKSLQESPSRASLGAKTPKQLKKMHSSTGSAMAGRRLSKLASSSIIVSKSSLPLLSQLSSKKSSGLKMQKNNSNMTGSDSTARKAWYMPQQQT
jgi:hypothetical protein